MEQVVEPTLDTVISLHGKGVAKGIAIGHAVIMGAALLEVKHHLIAPEDIEKECQRLDNAMRVVAEDLEYIKNNLPADAPIELAPVLGVHSMLLADPMLASETKEIIRSRRYNAEWAL